VAFSYYANVSVGAHKYVITSPHGEDSRMPQYGLCIVGAFGMVTRCSCGALSEVLKGVNQVTGLGEGSAPKLLKTTSFVRTNRITLALLAVRRHDFIFMNLLLVPFVHGAPSLLLREGVCG
jgi:hypothetical protein